MVMEQEESKSGIDPKKLFDKTKYNTLIIGREGFSASENDLATWLEILFEDNLPRIKAEEVFAKVKESNAVQFMVDTIEQVETVQQKAALTAACWEAGLDMSKHFVFFTGLAINRDFQLAMEALTVLEHCETVPDKATLRIAMDLVQTSEIYHPELRNQLINLLRTLLVKAI